MRNRRILLVSPQPWDHIPLSKHHYALELSRRGNTVFFLEPPQRSRRGTIVAEPIEGLPIVRVRWSSAIPLPVRYHARKIHDVFMRRAQRQIARAIGAPVDVVWSFEFNLFSDLRSFGAAFTIFHPVDPLTGPEQLAVAHSADAVLCVSEAIRGAFDGMDVPSAFINHGLSAPFAELARNPVETARSASDTVHVGYAGNLLRPELNRRVLRRMIEENTTAQFHFWGPCRDSSAPQEPLEFIAYLESRHNVKLHGRVSPAELARAIAAMDCFVLAYEVDPRTSDRSNSHKLLEYLSTGRAVVSSRIATYVLHADLIRMPANDDDNALPSLLTETIGRLEEFNSPDLSRRRRELALDNTYARQVDRIEAFLAANAKSLH